MNEVTRRTALITGANSGLGFEAAAQLAERDYRPVTITARTEAKVRAAQEALQARTGRDVFETLVLENADLATVEAAADSLAERRVAIDILLLNAGIAPSKALDRSAGGIEMTVASTLIGHHVLTIRLLEKGLLGESARIVISGSEAARGDVPMFTPVDIDAFAREHFGGDLDAAIEALIRVEAPAEYKRWDVYATAKLFVAWWAAELARKLPAGVTVNAVSPGSTPNTNGMRTAPFFMRRIMVPISKLVPGMSHSIDKGAGRYLEAAEFGDDISGKFFASRPGKMTGPLVEIGMDHFDNPPGQRALWSVTSRLAAGVGDPLHA